MHAGLFSHEVVYYTSFFKFSLQQFFCFFFHKNINITKHVTKYNKCINLNLHIIYHIRSKLIATLCVFFSNLVKKHLN